MLDILGVFVYNNYKKWRLSNGKRNDTEGNSLLDKYIGGEIFFDELDDAIRTDDNIIKGLLRLSTAICSLPVFGNENNTRIVMSGKTGYAIKEWGWDADILLPGGLRKMTDAPLDFAKQI